MQRCEDLYPSPSLDFAHISVYSPERREKWTPKSWHYIPFNGGPRICTGQQFALIEIGKFFAVRVQTKGLLIRVRLHDREDPATLQENRYVLEGRGTEAEVIYSPIAFQRREGGILGSEQIVNCAC